MGLSLNLSGLPTCQALSVRIAWSRKPSYPVPEVFKYGNKGKIVFPTDAQTCIIIFTYV